MRVVLGDVIPGTALGPLSTRFLVILLFFTKVKSRWPRQGLHSGRQEITYALSPLQAPVWALKYTAPCDEGTASPTRKPDPRVLEGSRTPATDASHTLWGCRHGGRALRQPPPAPSALTTSPPGHIYSSSFQNQVSTWGRSHPSTCGIYSLPNQTPVDQPPASL